MAKTMERSLMQTLFKYLPGAYADFDLEGYSVTARIFGWNAKLSAEENKSRIAYEISDRIRQYIQQSESKNMPQAFQVKIQNQFFQRIIDEGKECFDLQYLQGASSEDDKKPEIVSVIRPYVFYCTSCKLVHIITDYNLSESSKFLNQYKYRIKEIFDHHKHKCMKCNGKLRQQQIIRIDSYGNAYDYEPKCEKHLENTEYFLKKESVFDYRCSKCEKTIERKWNLSEKLTPALDPNAFFPQIVSILDTKDDDKVDELSKYLDLSKLLILREMDILSEKKYDELKNELIRIQKLHNFDYQSIDYRKAMMVSGINGHIKIFNEPAFNTFAQNNPTVFYTNVANKLIDITELQSHCTIDKISLMQLLKEEYDQNEFQNILGDLEKLIIDDIFVAENVPVTNIAYGYTRVSPEVGLTFPDQAILNVYKGKNDRYQFYSTKLLTEGVFIKLNTKLFIQWLRDNILTSNNERIFVVTNDNPAIDLFNNFIRSGTSNQVITSVLHTISHIILKEIASASGLEVTSVSEMIFPEVGGIFIYSTSNEGVILNSIKTAITKRLKIILRKSLEDMLSCSLKSICNSKEVSACLGCIFISEISCTMFNHNLNRKYLNAGDEVASEENQEKIVIKKGLWI